MIIGSTASLALKQKMRHENGSWQKALSSAVRDPAVLLDMLELSEQKYKDRIVYPDKFRLLVPLSYVNKMEKGNWDDPLLNQVLPLQEETNTTLGFSADPVGDLNAEISSGVLHKYQGRVLLVTTGACAVHCRYCFRQHFPYVDSISDKKHWQDTLTTLSTDSSIREVILSGGDPLMLSDDRLQVICEKIAKIPHIQTIRFHTRVPLFLPERINDDFLSWLTKLEIQKVMVIHANHANEIDELVGSGLLSIHETGTTMLNQAVLLKSINDNVLAQSNLSHKLFEYKVLPYYLHQLDKVQGAAHFEVDKRQGLELMKQLRELLPGYLIPRYVEELSGKRSKQTIV